MLTRQEGRDFAVGTTGNTEEWTPTLCVTTKWGRNRTK